MFHQPQTLFLCDGREPKSLSCAEVSERTLPVDTDQRLLEGQQQAERAGETKVFFPPVCGTVEGGSEKFQCQMEAFPSPAHPAVEGSGRFWGKENRFTPGIVPAEKGQTLFPAELAMRNRIFG